MDKEKCKKVELRDVVITVRVTKSMSKFIKELDLSPSMVMREALRNLGFKDNEKI